MIIHFSREPRLQPAVVTSLRPTQMTVGMGEVEAKRQAWRAQKSSNRAAFLGRHLIPVVMGPEKRLYLIDHHHLARALHDEGVEEIAVTMVADLSSLSGSAFWVNMDCRGWMHPYDHKGKRQSHKQLPKTIGELLDDPYRSLAGSLRRAGGFAKDTTPFSEFLWADFLRRRIKAKDVEASPDTVLKKALHLAKSEEASYLPGWCGPVDKE